MHAVVRTDRMFGTDNRGGLVSLRYQPVDGSTSKAVMTEIDNGNVVLLGGLEEGEREVYVADKPAANSDIHDVVLVDAPEVMYDNYKKDLGDYFNVAGKIVRGYYLHENDIFSVTKEALAGNAEPAVGDVVELKADTKLNVVDSLTQGSTQVGEIIAIDVVGKYTFYVIQVK